MKPLADQVLEGCPDDKDKKKKKKLGEAVSLYDQVTDGEFNVILESIREFSGAAEVLGEDAKNSQVWKQIEKSLDKCAEQVEKALKLLK